MWGLPVKTIIFFPFFKYIYSFCFYFYLLDFAKAWTDTRWLSNLFHQPLLILFQTKNKFRQPLITFSKVPCQFGLLVTLIETCFNVINRTFLWSFCLSCCFYISNYLILSKSSSDNLVLIYISKTPQVTSLAHQHVHGVPNLPNVCLPPCYPCSVQTHSAV